MRAPRHLVPALALLGVVLTPSPHARADVVGPPPTSCPTGSVGEVCHGSAYCSPVACATDSDCTGGLVCREQGLCLGSVGCYGRLPPDATPPPPRETADRTCSAGESCGATSCIVTLRCVPPTGAPSFSGCECRVSNARQSGFAGAVAFASALAVACVLGRRASRRRAARARGTLP